MIETAIRPATKHDHADIDRVNRLAFGGEAEARLVAALRDDGDVIVERVADDDDAIRGHILFSRLAIETGAGCVAAAALAPVAVVPAHQHHGIGTRLVDAGLAALRAAGCPAVIVLGHPGWYPRFGFSAALAGRLDSPFAGAAFMALELAPGALAAGGVVRYARAFGLAPSRKETPS